ncbi:MAG: hypothetical protein M1830_010773 [Pleopsidium flavum]|nr:MAG: hypothetical protein M1830_010773 [Pleopsidium flavum]
MPANHANRRTGGLGSLKAAQPNHQVKREFVKDEGGLFMSKGTVKSELVSDQDGSEEDQDDEEEEEEDSEDHGDKDELDDEIQERIDDFECPYDSSIELLPSYPAFHPAFKQVEHDYVNIIGKAVNQLQKAKYRDAETVRLAEEGLAIKEIKYALGTKVALIGNSGVGKSSVINSLFDTPKLASEGSSGSSCTHVVTEIRRTLPNQNQPFAADITFFDEAVRRLILQKHLGNYYRYFLESQEGLDRTTIDDNKTLAMTALETFRALFCDLDEFHNDICAKTFLSALTSEKDEQVLPQLYDWTDLLLSSLHADSGTVFLQASTVEDLADLVEPFTRTPPALDEETSPPAPWPLVQIVKLGVQSAFAKTGLIVADLPGLSDTNTNRVRATQRYQRECSFACVVAPISRVLTDNLVEGWLQDAFERWGSNKALICTYTDVSGGVPKHEL